MSFPWSSDTICENSPIVSLKHIFDDFLSNFRVNCLLRMSMIEHFIDSVGSHRVITHSHRVIVDEGNDILS